MAHPIPTSEPERLRAGDNATWTRALADYLPADGWVLKYALTGAGGQQLITATNNGDGSHLVAVAATTTDDWVPGSYTLQGYVELAGARYTVYEGYVEIEAGLHLSAYSAGLETRPTVKQTLDALEATILGKASKDQLSYSIAGRSLQNLSPDELIRWRDRYATLWQRELYRQRVAAGKPSSRIKKLRFGGVS